MILGENCEILQETGEINMTSSKIEQEKKFDILRNPAGELLIVIRARIDSEEKPQIVYDGGEHALLYRNKESTIVLDYIHPMVRENLSGAHSVLIVEAQGSAIIREYFATVKQTDKIPLPEIEAA